MSQHQMGNLHSSSVQSWEEPPVGLTEQFIPLSRPTQGYYATLHSPATHASQAPVPVHFLLVEAALSPLRPAAIASLLHIASVL